MFVLKLLVYLLVLGLVVPFYEQSPIDSSPSKRKRDASNADPDYVPDDEPDYDSEIELDESDVEKEYGDEVEREGFDIPYRVIKKAAAKDCIKTVGGKPVAIEECPEEIAHADRAPSDIIVDPEGTRKISRTFNELLKSLGNTNDWSIVQNSLDGLEQTWENDGESRETDFQTGFEKLKPTSQAKGRKSYNYALVVKDKTGIHDLDEGENIVPSKRREEDQRVFLLYWGKGVANRVNQHFYMATIYNELNEKYRDKLERPRILYEALSYFMAFPEYYEVGFIKFNEDSSDADVQKFEAALIQMKFSAAAVDAFNYVQLLNTKEELKRRGIKDLSNNELFAIMLESYSGNGGFKNLKPEYRTHANIIADAWYSFIRTEFEKYNPAFELMKSDEKLPFNFIQTSIWRISGLNQLRASPPEPKLLNLLMLKRERENGMQTLLGTIQSNFLKPFYTKIGFNFRRHDSMTRLRVVFRRTPKSFLDREFELTIEKLKEKKSTHKDELISETFRNDFNERFDSTLLDQQTVLRQSKTAAIFAQACVSKSSKFSPYLLLSVWKIAQPKLTELGLSLPELDGNIDDAFKAKRRVQDICWHDNPGLENPKALEKLEKFISTGPQAFGLSVEEYQPIKTIIKEASDEVITGNVKNSLHHAKLSYILLEVCNVTTFPYEFNRGTKEDKVLIKRDPPHSFYNKKQAVEWNGLMAYNVQRLIRAEFPEMRMPRITLKIYLDKIRKICQKRLECAEINAPLLNVAVMGAVRCRALEMITDESKKKKAFNEMSKAILSNKNKNYRLNADDMIQLEGFQERVSLALMDFEWDDDQSHVQFQTERVLCANDLDKNGKEMKIAEEIPEQRIDMTKDRWDTTSEGDRIPMSSLYLPLEPLKYNHYEQTFDQED